MREMTEYDDNEWFITVEVDPDQIEDPIQREILIEQLRKLKGV